MNQGEFDFDGGLGKAEDLEKIDKLGVWRRWNALAQKHGLCRVRHVTHYRLAKLRARMKEFPDFWEELDVELGLRGRWAREHQFPNFDQAVEPRHLLPLLEGNYRPKPAEEREMNVTNEKERSKRELIRRLRAHRGRRISGDREICRTVVVSASGYETKFESFRVEELERMLSELEGAAQQ